MSAGGPSAPPGSGLWEVMELNCDSFEAVKALGDAARYLCYTVQNDDGTTTCFLRMPT